MTQQTIPEEDPVLWLQTACRQLRDTLQAPGSHPLDADPPDPATAPWPRRVRPILAALDGLAVVLDQTVAPALLESMAGSDAVCIRELTQGLAQAHAALARRAARAMARPDDTGRSGTAAGSATPATAAAAGTGPYQAWVKETLEWLATAHDEVLPMAQRLLDPPALQAVAQACKKQPGLMQIIRGPAPHG